MTQTVPGPRTSDRTPDPAPTHETTVVETAQERPRLFDLSLTQLVGGSMAAATAAALGSRLGLLGTIAGAAVGSVVSAIAAHLYTTSMARARELVVVLRTRSRGDAGDAGDAATLALVPSPTWPAASRRRAAGATALLSAVALAVLAVVQLTTGASVTGTDLGGRGSAAPVVEAPAAGSGDAVTDARTNSSGSSLTGTPSTGPSATPGATPDVSAPGSAPATTPDASTTTPADPASPATPATPASPGTSGPSDEGTPTAPVGPSQSPAPAPTGSTPTR